MKQITFDNYRSFDDLYLILTSKEIGSPKIKEYTVKIEGSDGVLDYTEFFGGTHYENLTHKFEFSTTVQPALEYFSRLKDLLHGKKVRIALDDDPGFYYIGRLTISTLKNTNNIYKLSISCNCEPYKYKNNPTVVTKTISGSSDIILSNMRKRVVPTVTTSASMTFEWGGYSVTHSAGTFQIPEMELAEGNNTINVAGTGTVKFEYQEGGF